MYPIYFVAAAAASQLFLNYRKNYYAERDAVYRHYVELHPEDFPPPGNDLTCMHFIRKLQSIKALSR